MQKQKFVFLDTKTMRLRRTVNHEIFARVLFSRIGLICKIQYLQIWAIRLRSSLLSTAGTLLVLLCYVFFCLYNTVYMFCYFYSEFAANILNVK